MRVTYGVAGAGTATILVASPASDGLTASPGGVAVDPQGTVLTTLPYLPAAPPRRSTSRSDSISSMTRETARSRRIPSLGLTSVPDIDSTGITVDSQNNFILAVSTSSLYGGGPGVAHINSALTAFLADPTIAHRGDSVRNHLPGRGRNELPGARLIPTKERTPSPASFRSSAARSRPRSFGRPTASTRSASPGPAAPPSPAPVPARRSPSSRKGSTPRSKPTCIRSTSTSAFPIRRASRSSTRTE